MFVVHHGIGIIEKKQRVSKRKRDIDSQNKKMVKKTYKKKSKKTKISLKKEFHIMPNGVNYIR